MTAPQQGHVTILPPKRIKRRHTRRWKATVSILVILLLATAAIGGTLLHQRNKANSFPTLHAQGKDPVLQLQALYNAPDHAADALKKGNNTHIRSQVIGGGNDGTRELAIYIDTDDFVIGINSPVTLEAGKDSGEMACMLDLKGSSGPDMYLVEGHPPFSYESNAKWQQTLHMSKQQGIALAQHWVRTVLDTAAKNW